MSNENLSNNQPTEPLIKFHTSPNVKGQIVVPKRDRELLRLTKDDIIEIIVRKVEVSEDYIKIVGSAYIIAKLSSRGLVTIPEEVRSRLEISEHSVLEVLVVGFHKFEELVSPKGKSLLSQLSSKPFQILSPLDEPSLLKKAQKYYQYSIFEN